MNKEYTLGFGKANLYSILLIIPISLILLLPFIVIWGYDAFAAGMDSVLNLYYILLAGIAIHEILHLIGFSFFTSKGLKSLRIGFKLKYLILYCHCKEPLMVKHYKLGVVLPLLILGIIPSLYGFFTGNEIVFSFGLLFTFISGGDIIVLLMLAKLNNESYVLDHPGKMGFTEL